MIPTHGGPRYIWQPVKFGPLNAHCHAQEEVLFGCAVENLLLLEFSNVSQHFNNSGKKTNGLLSNFNQATFRGRSLTDVSLLQEQRLKIFNPDVAVAIIVRLRSSLLAVAMDSAAVCSVSG